MILGKVELEEKKFNFGSKSILFQRVKDVKNLPHDHCRLWALEWKSAFAFSDFLATCGSLSGFSILEIGTISK